jgi:hypothetical protein
MLHKDHHDKLVKMFDCLTHKEIDGRNSLDKDNVIWECISKMYNDPSWALRSHIFIKLQFYQEMTLSMSSNADGMTPN